MASGDLTLTYAEANALRDSSYPCPPGYLCPPGWELSTGGIPVSPTPRGQARRAAITHCYYVEFSHEQRMDPRWDPDNTATWDAFFAGRRERELARYEGNGPPPANNNEIGRSLWWDGRTLASVIRYILADDHPRLRYPRSHATNNINIVATRDPSPPRNYLHLMHPRADWQARPTYAMPTHTPSCTGAHYLLKRHEQTCVCPGNAEVTSNRHGRVSPPSQPVHPRSQSPRYFQPRPASDASDDSGEYDDYEFMYYTPRQEYD